MENDNESIDVKIKEGTNFTIDDVTEDLSHATHRPKLVCIPNPASTTRKNTSQAKRASDFEAFLNAQSDQLDDYEK